MFGRDMASPFLVSPLDAVWDSVPYDFRLSPAAVLAIVAYILLDQRKRGLSETAILLSLKRVIDAHMVCRTK